MTISLLAKAVVSFVAVFVGAYFVAGFLLLPLLPHTGKRVHWFEIEYWNGNWPGWILGIGLGAVSAYLVFRTEARRNQK